MSDTKVKSEAPVAARAQYDETGDSGIEDRAKEQEKLQAKELKDGESGGVTKDGATVAHNRGASDTGVQNGFVDQLVRKDASQVMEGHFCTVDRNHKDVDEDLLPAGEDGFGVYFEPATLDGDGYPVTAVVRLRDATNRRLVVPYEALRPTDRVGR